MTESNAAIKQIIVSNVFHEWINECIFAAVLSHASTCNMLAFIEVMVWHQTDEKPFFWMATINTLRPRQNEQHFADDIFKRIFFNENVWISIRISLKFVPKGPINNIPALV